MVKFIYTFRMTFPYFEICTTPCETPHIGMAFVLHLLIKISVHHRFMPGDIEIVSTINLQLVCRHNFTSDIVERMSESFVFR